MSPPDYVILGAMKCGTTTLAAQLGAQPGLFMTDPKEPQYFSDDAVFARGPDWYASLFAAAAPGDLRGEASTHYAKLPDRPDAAPRLQAAAPDARLIYLVRDPVARAVSHYVHEWSRGVIGRREGFEAALARLPEMVDYGRYAMQLAPWIERFGTARVHVDTLEAMRADPQAVLARVGAFLGREGLAWRDDLGRENAGAARMRRGRLDAVVLHSAPAAWLRRAVVPQALRDRVKARRRLPRPPEIPAHVRARMEAAFAEDRARLHAMLPGRPDLDAAYPFVAASSVAGRPA